jgi:predicted MFS family arabinose efflux permease
VLDEPFDHGTTLPTGRGAPRYYGHRPVLGRLLDDSYSPAIRRGVTTVTAARLGANALYRFAPPLAAVIARGLDVSVAELGVALTVAELGGFAAPAVGRVVDVISRRAALSWGLLGVSSGAVIVASSRHLAPFAAGLLLMSLAKILFDVGQGSWIADHVPFARRGRVVGLSETSWAFGLLVGVSTMALITAASSWPWAYAAGATATAVMAAVVWRRIGPDQPGTRAHLGARAGGRARLSRSGWLAVVAVGALAAASQSLFVTFGAWLDEDHGIGATGLAGVTFGLGALELLSSSLATARTDRWGKERSVAAGGLVMVAASIGLAAAHHWLAGALVLLGVFIAAFEFGIVSFIPIAGDLVPGRPGAGLGRFVHAVAIGRSLVTIPATALLDRWGIVPCAGLGATLAGTVAVLLAVRHRLGEAATYPR